MEQGASVNIILELSNFIGTILSDDILSMTEKHEFLIVALKTMMNLCTGDQQSQKIAGENKRMLNFIAHNVIN